VKGALKTGCGFCGQFRKIGRSAQSRGKIWTALPSINSNRLTDLFLGNKAVKTGLWCSRAKSVVCLQLNVVCRFYFPGETIM
jgi:hypothetical protein